MTKKRIHPTVGALALLMALAAACTIPIVQETPVPPVTDRQEPRPTYTFYPTYTPFPTLTPVPPPTSLPPTPEPLPPTPTPFPPPPPPPPAYPPAYPGFPIRIQFEPGGTSASVQGWLPTNGGALYVLRAQVGQEMSVWVQSPRNNVYLGVWGAEDGQVYQRPSSQLSYWNGTLPRTQDYILQVQTWGTESAYSVHVDIPPAPSPGPDPLPAPTAIFFQPDTTSGIEYGRLAPGAVQRYRLHALAGQQFWVEVWSEPMVGVGISVDGEQTGHNWSQPPQVGSLYIPELPAKQDYVITLWPPEGHWQEIHYTMRVTIP